VTGAAETFAVVSPPVSRRRHLVLVAVVAVVTVACDTNDGRELRPAAPDQTASVFNSTTTTIPPDPAVLGSGVPGEGVGELGMTLRAPWQDEAVIDSRFTCDSTGGVSGEGLSPALSWSGVPAEATNLAVVVTDLSADGFVHWVVTGIDPGVTGLGEGEAPAGGIQGTNGFGEVGWGGPCPPPGTGEHEYLVQLHALDQDLGLAPGFDGEEAIPEIEAASIATVSVVGRYSAAADAARASTTTARPSTAAPSTSRAAATTAATTTTAG
jgi:Raf kinase inhibitor-like YbhB/YbcL family protein